MVENDASEAAYNPERQTLMEWASGRAQRIACHEKQKGLTTDGPRQHKGKVRKDVAKATLRTIFPWLMLPRSHTPPRIYFAGPPEDVTDSHVQRRVSIHVVL